MLNAEELAWWTRGCFPSSAVCGLSGILEPPGVDGRDSGGSISMGCSKLSRALRALFLLTTDILSASSLARALPQWLACSCSLDSFEFELRVLGFRLATWGIGGRLGGCNPLFPRRLPFLPPTPPPLLLGNPWLVRGRAGDSALEGEKGEGGASELLALRGGGASKDSKSKVICSGLTSGRSLAAVEEEGEAGDGAALDSDGEAVWSLDRLCGPRLLENISKWSRYTCTRTMRRG